MSRISATCRNEPRNPIIGFKGLAALATDELAAFVSNVDRILKKRKIPRKDFADAIERAPSLVTYLLSGGAKSIDLGLACKIARVLDVPLEQLIRKDGGSSPPPKEVAERTEQIRRSIRKEVLKEIAEGWGLDVRIRPGPRLKAHDD